MHNDDVYLKFLDWFEDKFGLKQAESDKPEVAEEEADTQKREANSRLTPRGTAGASSQQMSYNERRQQMKASNQKSGKQELQTYD